MGWHFFTSYFYEKMILYSPASYEIGQTVLVPRDGGSFDSGGLATKASKVPPPTFQLDGANFISYITRASCLLIH